MCNLIDTLISRLRAIILKVYCFSDGGFNFTDEGERYM
jgi:hypothetical protein